MLPKNHPVRAQHLNHYPGVLEKTKEIRSTSDVDFKVSMSSNARQLGCVAYNDILPRYPTLADYEKSVERAQRRRYKTINRREEEIMAEIEAEELEEQ